jgi:two-component system, NarL family, nitrate/nitrite sensor histidine kinase NarX
MEQVPELTGSRTHELLTRFGDRLLGWRWPLVVFLGFLLLLAEVFEHTGEASFEITIVFCFEAFLLGIVLPGLLGLVLDQLVRNKERAKLDRSYAVEAERNVISRDLHDTLGQHLSFLHFKLDQLASGDVSNQRDELRRQLAEMRDLSNEAYEHVTGTLTILRNSDASTIGETLLAYAKWIGSRAGFEARLVSEGQPRLLPPYEREQILYIFREAIRNAEKHAVAKHLVISIIWAANYVDIRVSDDGRGFDTAAPQPPGHFGRAVMSERAHDIGWQLCISSRPGRGTDVALRAPLPRVEVALPHKT